MDVSAFPKLLLLLVPGEIRLAVMADCSWPNWMPVHSHKQTNQHLHLAAITQASNRNNNGGVFTVLSRIYNELRIII